MSKKTGARNLDKKDKEYMEWWDSIAPEYKSKVLSPLAPGVKNPIHGFVNKLNPKHYKRVADLGCGPGDFLGFLSKRFQEVWGIDWSENMLRMAAKRYGRKKNIHLEKLNIRNLKKYYGYFDAAFSINTIPSYSDTLAEEMLAEIFRSLREGGVFAAVFPSLDAVLYQRELTYARYIEEGLTSSEAWQKTDDYFIRRNKLNLETGTYADDGIHEQKFLTESEIYPFLQRVGFKDIMIDRVLYPWDECEKHGYGCFPDKPEIWDCFSAARK